MTVQQPKLCVCTQGICFPSRTYNQPPVEKELFPYFLRRLFLVPGGEKKEREPSITNDRIRRRLLSFWSLFSYTFVCVRVDILYLF